MIRHKIGIIGCGHMGEALLKGLCGVVEKSTMIIASELDAARREEIQGRYKMIVSIDNNYLVKNSDVIILAVKPHDLQEVLRTEVCCGVSREKLIISIAAGIKTHRIEDALEPGVPVVRAMPNLPATIGQAITSISAGKWAAVSHINTAKEIFSSIGDVVEVDEKLVDAVTAISGSGPAYFFYLAEAMVEAAHELGIDKKTAEKLVIKTALGSAGLLQELGESPQILRKKVTSKGGTTEAAMSVFDKKDIKKSLKEAIKKAHSRSLELSKE